MNLHLVLLVLALVSELLATINLPARINWMALGLVFFFLSLLVGVVR